MMTEEFRNSCAQGNQLFETVFSLMILGKKSKDKALYNEAKPLLTLLDNYINYNLNKQDGAIHRIPLFISYSTAPKIREIFIEYLIVRLGVMNPATIEAFSDEERKDTQRGAIIEPEKDDSPFSKQYYRRIDFYPSEENPLRQLCYGAASRFFRRQALALSKEVNIPECPTHNMIICKKSELPLAKSSLLKDFIIESIVPQKGRVFCNSSYNGEAFLYALDENRVANPDDPIHANVFMLYSATEQADFYPQDVELMGQIGYQVDNLFIFVLHSRPFCLTNLKRDLVKFQAKYTKDVFFLDADETAFLHNGTVPLLNQILVGHDDDYQSYGLEVHNILDGLHRPYNVRNIIGLCATDKFEKLFFKFIQEENPGDYDLPESTELFDYMRLLWRERIVPAVNSFAKDKRVAFVVDWKTPKPICKEIATLFPDKTVSFHSTRALKPKGKQKNDISAPYIVLLRYTGFKENDFYSPNSYEPTVLRDNQQLLEIIPMALFAAHVARTKNNLVRFFNSAMQNGYREDCLGWRRQNTETLTRFSIERDEDDDYKTPEREATKVIISYASGRVSSQIESTPVIYRKGNQTVAGRLVEIIDDPSVTELQLVDEIENHLGILVNEAEQHDSTLEKVQRHYYVQNYGIAANPDIEIWRLLLMKKAEDNGKDAVIQELSDRIKQYEKNPKVIINRWLDGKSTNLILPRRKKTKNIVFDYLGIPATSPYRGIVYRKKMRTIQFSLEKNKLLDQIIFAIVNGQAGPGAFHSLSAQIPDAMDLLGINNDKDLRVIRHEVLSSINMSNINGVTYA